MSPCLVPSNLSLRHGWSRKADPTRCSPKQPTAASILSGNMMSYHRWLTHRGFPTSHHLNMTAFHHPDLFTGESWVRGLMLYPWAQGHVWHSVASICDWACENTHAHSHTQIPFLVEGHFHSRQLSSTGLTLKLVTIRMFHNHNHQGRNWGGVVYIYLYIPSTGLDTLRIVFHLIFKMLCGRQYSPVELEKLRSEGLRNFPTVTELVMVGLRFQPKSLWLQCGLNSTYRSVLSPHLDLKKKKKDFIL